ncbi:hypothetical protein F5146DRAFT_1015875 [Armillaria mellea]|nr:hypothetical protein F5146DRAFT_1015875 [Armillaria mellea]
MSPRTPSTSSPTSSRSASAPYLRRPSGQPKSSRQQFSACGACRMRRVRCDLKDLPIATAGPNPACSNCKERGLKCVDEFADVKAVKLLRRGRRLQQVEAIYGKATDSQNGSSHFASPATHLPSIIPQLKPEFFSSPFWRWFSVQRPVLDPVEFSGRFLAHAKGTHLLGHEGSVIALLLVVWAASFGVDEQGVPIENEDHDYELGSVSMGHGDYSMQRNTRSASVSSRPSKGRNGDSSKSRVGRKETTEAMLREVLELVDYHSIMRKPSWDGIRVLLLILPLLEDANPLDRLTMHEATLLQAHSLCALSPSPSTSTISHTSDDAIVRARIFWYAHLQEGITTGMRGGRLILTEDDLDTFQSTLPPYNFGLNSASGLSSPSSSSFMASSHPYLQVTHLFSIPLHLSSVCRKVHAVLTGAKAARKAEEGAGVDGEGMREVWEGLERCWGEFEELKRPNGMESETDAQVERFASAWQIFIFECYNIIREALKQYVSRSASSTSASSPQPMFATTSHPSPKGSPHGQSPPPYYTLHQLHAMATRKCVRILPYVLGIIKHHLSCDVVDTSGMFKWDAGLVRDGCFFAGFLSASSESNILADPDDRQQFGSMKQESDARIDGSLPPLLARSSYLPIYDAEDGVRICLTALSTMRWAFSKSEERRETLRMVWEDSKMRKRTIQSFSHPHTPHTAEAPSSALREIDLRYAEEAAAQPTSSSYVDMYGGGKVPASIHHLPPLNLSNISASHHVSVDSAPTTGYSTDGSAGANSWPSYTPPGTGTSTSGTSATGNAVRSPVFSSLVPNAGIKSEGMLYHNVSTDLEPFGFNAPATGTDVSGVMVGYHHSPHQTRGGGAGNFMDFAQSGNAPLGHPVSDGIDFGEDGNGYYH